MQKLETNIRPCLGATVDAIKCKARQTLDTKPERQEILLKMIAESQHYDLSKQIGVTVTKIVFMKSVINN